MKIMYPNGKRKAVTFSYDDNQIHDRRLIEILNQYGLKGTFHLNSGRIGANSENDDFIAWEEVKELYSGHEVACHGLYHPYFGQLSKTELQYQILEDKRLLENAVNYVIRGMSYPFGEYTEETITVASALGIEYSRTVEATGGFGWPADFMKWHPTCHQNEVFFHDELIERFLNSPAYLNLPLFYIWGHSFEFPREDTWEKMEQLCDKLHACEEIWYATNIEIKDYICAVRNLIYSVDHKIIYNPTSVTVYLEHGDSLHVLSPGETFLL